ncbi:EscU/YscU/HrcU family type III secretion system export apparatus switch protein [Vibrio chagasii]|nr:EscU/YscU/HrcU family type III secretion system export apparatus switch protein [Vibrio chagasii]
MKGLSLSLLCCIKNIELHLSDHQFLVSAQFDTVVLSVATITIEFLGYLLLIVLLFGLFDFLINDMNLQKQMKMTKQEVKDEHKEQEGRPEVKARIRQIQTQNAKRSANERVPKASVVLTNPTRYAIAPSL